MYNQNERKKEWRTTVGAKEEERKEGREWGGTREEEGRKEGRKSSTKLRAFLHNDFVTHAKENQIAYEE